MPHELFEHFPLGHTEVAVDTMLGYEKLFFVNRSGVSIPTKYRIVKNTSATAVLPKLCYKFDITSLGAGGFGSEVDDLAGDNVAGRPADENLPAAGAAVGNMFWLAMDGPAKCVTASATAIAIGDYISTDAAGEVSEEPAVSAAADAYNNLHSRLGRAMEAVSTDAADILVYLGHP